MNIKAFFVAALQSALDLGIATCDDVVRHVNPDVLATHLPRPLWARLLTACFGAPRVDAVLVVETIGVPNLCEHVPSSIIWACIAEIGVRSLSAGRTAIAAPPPIVTRPLSIAMAPPPDVIVSAAAATAGLGPAIPSPGSHPLEDLVAELESEDRPGTTMPSRARTPTGQRFRQSTTGIGRLAANNKERRPQAQAASPPPPAAPSAEPDRPVRVRRGQTDADFELETDVKSDDWKNALAVDDEQLIDWSAAEETATTNKDDTSRKR